MMLGIGLGALVYLGMSFYLGWGGLLEASALFDWRVLPALLMLSLANYVIRFAKWHYYLRRIHVPLLGVDSFLVFLAGLMLSITPGKLGEVIKAYLVKARIGTRVSVVAPVVFAERLTDVAALVVLSLAGGFALDVGRPAILAGGALTLVGLGVVSSRALVLSVLRRLEHLPAVGKNVERLEVAYDSASRLVAPRPLLVATGLSVVAWGAECLAYGLTISGFGVDVPLGAASFTYAVSTIIGALSMLPGGLGSTEASLTALSVELFGMTENVAGLAAIIVRASTLWFAVGVGAVALLVAGRRFGGVDLAGADAPEDDLSPGD